MINKGTNLRPADGHEDHSNSIFDNVEIFIEKFDGADRDGWQKPDEVIRAFDLPDNAVVVDIGSGTGYFAVRIAPYVKNGKVICFDQSSPMTAHLRDRANELGLSNIDARITKSDGSFELEEKADLIFSVDVYHHLQDRVAYFSKITQHLKPKGVFVVIDRTEEKIEGQPTGHRVSAEKVKEEMKQAGFELVNDFGFLLPVQYYLAFKKTV
jgi:cyclopropane fatty-acyl-phospholipid synthase-like methyltransferase